MNSIGNGTSKISPEQIEVRLIKYQIGANTYVLCTTLKDKIKYPKEDFPEVYHARWGIEEMIKVSKVITGVQDFHAKTEKGIQQELYAHFLSVTLTKIVELQSHREVEKKQVDKTPPKRRIKTISNQNIRRELCENSNVDLQNKAFKVNIKNCFLNLCGMLTRLLYLDPQQLAKNVIETLLESSKTLYQKVRPNRNYPRLSRQPINK